MARIGDFREALLSPEAVAAHGSADAATGGGFGAALFGGSGGSSGGGARGSKSSGGSGARSGSKQGLAIRDAYTALKLCCWLNTLEKRLFSAPYESKDCEAKVGLLTARSTAPDWLPWTCMLAGTLHGVHCHDLTLALAFLTSHILLILPCSLSTSCHALLLYWLTLRVPGATGRTSEWGFLTGRRRLQRLSGMPFEQLAYAS